MYPSQGLNSGIEPEADEDPEVNLPPLSFKVEDQKIWKGLLSSQLCVS